MQDPERDPKERTLIFVQTKKNADFLATYLSGEGLPTTSIHGDRWSVAYLISCDEDVEVKLIENVFFCLMCDDCFLVCSA